MLTKNHIRALYIVSIGGISISWAYLSLLMKNNDLSPDDIGIVLGVGTFASAILSWQCGRLAQAHVPGTRLMQWVAVAGSLGFVASASSQTFWQFFFANILLTGAQGCITMLLPMLAMTTTKPETEGKQLSRYRMCGSIGFMASTYGIAILVNFIELKSAFYVASGIALLPVILLYGRSNTTAARDALQPATPLSPNENRVRIGLFLSYFLFSICFPCNFAFLSVYAKHLGATEQQAGYLMGSNGPIALVGLFLVGILIDRIGATRVLIIGFLCQPLRSFGYSMADSYLWLFAPQLFHFFTFACWEVCSPLLVSQYFGASRQRHVYGQLVGCNMCAMVLGSFMTGWLIEGVGYENMYRIFAALATAGCLILWGTLTLAKRTLPPTVS